MGVTSVSSGQKGPEDGSCRNWCVSSRSTVSSRQFAMGVRLDW